MGTRQGRRFSNYEIVGEAGRGAMSVVYRAVDTRMGRHVALKVLSGAAHLSQEQRDDMLVRLRREARAIASLSHPNILTIYDVGESEGEPFLVMEYLEGRTLRARLDRGPLSPDEAANVLRQVASGLDAVHAGGIVHRDVKPANVMLLPNGRVTLMDFGVARGLDDTLMTQTGTMVGSPAYMAPEQVEGGTASPSSDRWALGVLLYEMLSGAPPFAGKSIPQVMYQVAHDRPRPLPNASAAVQAVLSRALAKNPERRYDSAGKLSTAFASAIGSPETPETKVAVQAPAVSGRRRPRMPIWLLPLLLLGAATGELLRLGQRHAPVTASRSRMPSPPVARYPQPSPVPAERPRAMIASRLSRRPPKIRLAPRPTSPIVVATQAPTHRHPRHDRRRVSPSPPPVPLFARMPARHQRSEPTPPRLAVVPAAHHNRALQTHLARVRAVPQTSPASRPAAASQAALLGTWHGWEGIHSHAPAQLTITRQQGQGFAGVMTIHTPEDAIVRVALAGRVLPGGRVTMHETRVLSSSRPGAWDLGDKSGQFGVRGMAGVDHDVRGRTAYWSFSR